MSDLPLALDRAAPTPLHRQLYVAIRAAILGGRLPAGSQLPPGRTLAAQLGVSRSTVTVAYEQLIAEGYLTAQQGAGTFVAEIAAPEQPVPPAPPGAAAATPWAENMEGAWPTPPRFDFRYGSPNAAELPLRTWARLVARQWRQPDPALLAYGDPAGWWPLREALAAYLARARAVSAAPGAMIVTSGSQQALDLIARVLLRPGDHVAMEEPGYRGARRAFVAAGATVVPVAVDDEGLDPARLASLSPTPRLVYLTPSHQFPTGAVMPLARRLALLAWAEQSGALIVEDDYDSEFRYRGAPLAALHGLDGGHRVLYVGTFSKSFFPGLRLGYLVAPATWLPALVALKRTADRQSPSLEQAAMAELLREGHFERHLRRLRRRYSARREAMLASLAHHGLAPAASAPAGLHILLPLPPNSNEGAVVRAAAAAGVAVTPAAPYSAHPTPPPRLLLGYTAISDARIEAGIARLAACLPTPRRN